MAKVDDNIIMKSMSGAIGKQLVFRKVNGKTIASKCPDRSHVVYTEEHVEKHPFIIPPYRILWMQKNKREPAHLYKSNAPLSRKRTVRPVH